MDLVSTGIAVGCVLWTIYNTFFQKKDTNQKKLDTTRNQLITDYEKRIAQLEEKNQDNESRISALEQQTAEQGRIIQGLYEKNKELLEFVQGRDPAIQEFILNSNGALQKFNTDTAPKVDQIHAKITTMPPLQQ